MKGRKNIPPNDKPVRIIPPIQTLILPKRFDSGIQTGTKSEEGTM